MGNTSGRAVVTVDQISTYIEKYQIHTGDPDFYLNLDDVKPEEPGTIPERLAELSVEEVTQQLLRYGIFITENNDFSDDDFRGILKKIQAPLFWSKHYAFHPNGSRVKNYLWVHGRYRQQAQGLLDIFEAIKNNSDLRKENLLKLTLSFQKFQKKLEGYYTYENEQLFKFFMDFPDTLIRTNREDENPSPLSILFENRKEAIGDHRLEEAFEKFKDKLEDKDLLEEVEKLLKEFVSKLLRDLAIEEKVLIASWLNLSKDEYATYRSYLTWKYATLY